MTPRRRINAASPNAAVTVQELDLTSLDNIRKAADELRAAHPRIDLLINNAGVMYTDKATTKDGFELQFGTNHLGHFALTGLLLDNMLGRGRFPRGDGQQRRPPHQGPNPFRRPAVGAQLQPRRRLRPVQAGQPAVHLRAGAPAEAKGAPTIATAAHPGAADTELLRNMPGGIRQVSQFFWSNFIAQDAGHGGASRRCAPRPIPSAQSGQYYGPSGLGEQRGHPKVVESSAQSHDEDIQRRLWTVSEELTGVTYPV